MADCRLQIAGGRRQEAGGRRQEAGGRIHAFHGSWPRQISDTVRTMRLPQSQQQSTAVNSSQKQSAAVSSSQQLMENESALVWAGRCGRGRQNWPVMAGPHTSLEGVQQETGRRPSSLLLLPSSFPVGRVLLPISTC